MHPQSIDNSSALRQINAHYPAISASSIESGIIKFAGDNRFALRWDVQPENILKTSVKMYRSDIKFIGSWDKFEHTIDLHVFPVLREKVNEDAIDQGVSAFSLTMKTITGLKISEKILRKSPKTTEQVNSINSIRNAEFNVPNGMFSQVRKLLLSYADKNGFAIRLSQSSSNSDDIKAYLYHENLEIIINTDYPMMSPMSVSCYPLVGSEKPTQVTIDQLYNDLKNEVQTINGVKFEYVE